MKFYFHLVVFLVFTFKVIASNDWMLISETISSNKTINVVMISEINSKAEFKIINSNNESVIYSQLSINGFTEYIIISKSDTPIKYKIFIRDKQLNNYHLKPLIKINKNNNKKEIEYYKNLNQVRKKWLNNKKDERVIALKDLINLINQNAMSKFKIELLFYQLSMLLDLEKFNEVIQLVDENYDSMNPESMMSLDWYKAISILEIGEFNKSRTIFKSILNNISKSSNKKISSRLSKGKYLAYYGLSQSLQYYHANDISIPDGFNNINLALDIVSEIGNNQLLSEVLYILASYYASKDNWLESIATLDVAIIYLLKSKSEDNLIGIYNQKAIAYKSLNQVSMALKYYRKAISNLDQNVTNGTKANIYNNIAAIYELLGNNALALRYFKQSFFQYQKMNSLSGMAIVSKSLGKIQRSNGHIKKAIKSHLFSIDYFKNHVERQYLETLAELSIDYYTIGDIGKAKTEAFKLLLYSNYTRLSILETKTVNINKKDYAVNNLLTNNSNSEIETFINDKLMLLNSISELIALKVLAKIYYDEGEINKASHYISLIDQNGINNILPINHKLDLFELKLKILSYEDNSNELVKEARKYLNYIDVIRQKFDVSDLALHWNNKGKSILNIYINFLLDHKMIEEIYNILERYYAINLREKRHNPTNQLIMLKSDKIQQALNEYVTLERQTLLSDDSEIQNQADEAKEHFLALNEETESPIKKIELELLSIKQLQEKLAIDELFLRYYINDNNAFVYVIDKDAYEIKKLPNSIELHDIVKNIIASTKSKRFNNLINQEDIYKKILPYKKIQNKKYNKIIINPDGILNLIPFAAINISTERGVYLPLTTQIDIERTYSASDYFTKINLPGKNSNTISVFSNPIFISNIDDNEIKSQFTADNKLWEFKSLPYTDKEADHIKEIFPDVEINLMSGNQATNENFLAKANRDANIIHIATHGFFNDSNLENVGIATSIIDENNELSAGVLAMREILYQPFKANLAVVSGCETTLGKEINGEGFNSLSRGLLSQGVNSVIGTIWSISDRATPIFMKEFYTNLRDMDGNVSKALNQAKKNFATQPEFRRYRHPYYWAGFVLTSSNKKISENIFN